jgi:hypothetical protein
MNTLNNFISPFVERAISMSKSATDEDDEGKDFTHSLSKFTQDRKVLRDQLVSTLLAGRDTTACTLSWLFYELAYHPDVFSRLREEILSTVGKHGMPTYEDLKGMKYLQWCLNESIFPPCQSKLALRLYPIVPFNVRTSLVDTTLPTGGGPNGNEVPPPPTNPLISSQLPSQPTPRSPTPQCACNDEKTFSDPPSATSIPPDGKLGLPSPGHISPSTVGHEFVLDKTLR